MVSRIRQRVPPCCVIRNGVVIGAIALQDEVRPEFSWRSLPCGRPNVHVVMITGDARQVAEAVAADIGVDESGQYVLAPGGWPGSVIGSGTGVRAPRGLRLSPSQVYA